MLNLLPIFRLIILTEIIYISPSCRGQVLDVLLQVTAVLSHTRIYTKEYKTCQQNLFLLKRICSQFLVVSIITEMIMDINSC